VVKLGSVGSCWFEACGAMPACKCMLADWQASQCQRRRATSAEAALEGSLEPDATCLLACMQGADEEQPAGGAAGQSRPPGGAGQRELLFIDVFDGGRVMDRQVLRVLGLVMGHAVLYPAVPSCAAGALLNSTVALQLGPGLQCPCCAMLS